MSEKRFYVYKLCDPRDGQPFYIGKGSGGRMKAHVRLVEKGKADNPYKCGKIIDILNAGLKVQEEIICAGLTESEAFELERLEISEHGWLSNISRGQQTAEDAKRKLALFWLSRLKSYGQWVRECPRQIGWVKNEFGDAGAFYEKFVFNLRQVAGVQ